MTLLWGNIFADLGSLKLRMTSVLRTEDILLGGLKDSSMVLITGCCLNHFPQKAHDGLALTVTVTCQANSYQSWRS